MADATTTLLRASSLQAGSDDSYVGSAQHLDLLRSCAQERAPGVTVEWADYSYSERSDGGPRIGVKHPSKYDLASSGDRARLAAAYLVHEIHHVLHSDHATLEAFEGRTLTGARRAGMREVNPKWIIALCNQLEDRRIVELAATDDPGDVELLEIVHRTGFEIAVRSYEAANGEEPWGPAPRDPGEQLSLALSALILLDEAYEITDQNRAIVDDVRRHLAAWVAGGTSTVIDATEAICSIIVVHSTR